MIPNEQQVWDSLQKHKIGERTRMNIECIDYLREQGLTPELMNRDIFSRLDSEITSELKVREAFKKKYGFAVLSEPAIAAIRPHGPILEIGAGMGYWTYELKRNGIDAVATDLYEDGWFREGRWLRVGDQWTDVERLEASEAVRKYPDRNLLSVWPNYDEDWAAKALEIFAGNVMIYVGEFGGCTANERFHDLLEKRFEEIESVHIPTFMGLHDMMVVFKRRVQ